MYYLELIGFLLKYKVILNFVAPVGQEITHSVGQIRMRLISQLISDISRFSKNQSKYFNNTAVSASFVSLLFGVFLAIYLFLICTLVPTSGTSKRHHPGPC